MTSAMPPIIDQHSHSGYRVRARDAAREILRRPPAAFMGRYTRRRERGLEIPPAPVMFWPFSV
jgi:hypothetical protein